MKVFSAKVDSEIIWSNPSFYRWGHWGHKTGNDSAKATQGIWRQSEDWNPDFMFPRELRYSGTIPAVSAMKILGRRAVLVFYFFSFPSRRSWLQKYREPESLALFPFGSESRKQPVEETGGKASLWAARLVDCVVDVLPLVEGVKAGGEGKGFIPLPGPAVQGRMLLVDCQDPTALPQPPSPHPNPSTVTTSMST